LGGLYLAGLGVPYDPAQAKIWLEKSARGGNGTAAFDLALMYEKGDGVPIDAAQSLAWYEAAAQKGVPAAMLKAGKAYRDGWGATSDPKKAAAYLKEAAEAGDPDAQNLYAIMIAKQETQGTQVEAYAWFLLAERAGQPDAAANRSLLRPVLSDSDFAAAEDRAKHWQPNPAR
jgi:TPR repeat protein